MSAAAAPVVIAGGGIGGLATALACARLRMPAVVCEKRAEPSEDGAGIQIGPNGTRVLRDLGVAARLEARVASPDAISVHSIASGGDLARLPLGDWIARRHGAPYWTAHRRDLQAALLDAAAAHPLITLRYGTEITSFGDGTAGVEAVSSSGESIVGRALIAADGLWSHLRGRISDTPGPAAVGKSAFRAIAARGELPTDLAANDVHIWLGEGCHVVHYPVRAGREVAIVAIVDDDARREDWSTPASVDWIDCHRQVLPARLEPALRAIDSWRAWSLMGLPPLLSWTRGRAALLGDAAHPVMPFLAQGAVLALEDAVTIARYLAEDEGDVASSLVSYESDRRARASRVAAASRQNGGIYHMSGLAAAARDAVLATLPGAVLMSRYDWLYGWRAREPAAAAALASGAR